MPGKRLAIASLALGLPGLFTGGLLGVGAVAGLLLATAALVAVYRSPGSPGRDVAWAALAANTFALVSLVPLVVLGLTLRPMIAAQWTADDALPTPWTAGRHASEPVSIPPPPPPPPPPRRATRQTGQPDAMAPETSLPLRVGGKVREPRKIKNVVPAYPDIAKEARVQGVVILECVVSAEGRVTRVRVLRGIPLLDEAAISAVRQWEYEPTSMNGRPVPVIMTVTVNFLLH